MFAFLLLAALSVCSCALGQGIGGHGIIAGYVTDPSGAAIPEAKVIVTNTETGVSTEVTSNRTGYYEARQLLPGPYSIKTTVVGFTPLERAGITVATGNIFQVQLKLEIGTQNQTVVVTAAAPLLNLDSGSNPQTLDNAIVSQVPVSGSNPGLLVKLSQGIQASDAQNQYMAGSLYAGGANSSFGTAGQYKMNEFSLDGAPNVGGSHQVNYSSTSDETKEISSDASGFDASVGKTLGASVETISKNGTNQYHGTLRTEYNSRRWQPLSHFTRLAYLNNTYLGTTAATSPCVPDPSSAACQAAKTKYGQPGLHSFVYGGTIGGPITIPKIYNGHDKLFFFFSYTHEYFPDIVSGSSTVATAQQRTGNFSDLPCIIGGTAILNPVYSAGSCPNPATADFGQYAIYDPTTTRVDAAHAGHYIRTAFAGNIIPTGRIQNPLASFFAKDVPLPNTADSAGNFADTANYTYSLTQPQNYYAYSPRIDYAINAKNHVFMRAGNGSFGYLRPACCFNDNLGQLYNGRKFLVITAGYDHTFSDRLVMSTSIGYSRYAGPANYPIARGQSAASLGLPGYLDGQAAASGGDVLPPTVSINTYSGLGLGSGSNTGFQKTESIRSNLTWVHGSQTTRFGGEFRQQQTVSGVGNGNANGTLTFDNTYTRVSDNASYLPTGSSSLGTSYAALLLGYQTSASQAVGVDNRRSNPYYGLFVQNTYRVNRKLTVNAGVRYEYEFAPAESQNRQIVTFDPTQQLAIAPASQSAYAANLAAYQSRIPAGLPGLPGSANIAGGAVYAGQNGASTRIFQNSYRILPRVAVAFQATPKTVIRAGYGLFFDTLNVLNNGNDQNGFSTSTTIASSNNNGLSFVSGTGIPVANPFPADSTGTRFQSPVGNSLGNLIYTGSSQSFYPTDYVPARQQRWQLSMQRQLDKSSMLQVTYEGSWTDRIGLDRNIRPVPEAYYTTGQAVNPNNSALTTNVTNPFNISNYSGLQSTNPTAYAYLAKNGFFTSSTISLSNLLTPYPAQSGLTLRDTTGQSKFNSIEAFYTRRFNKNLTLNATYSRNFQYDRDWFPNAYDVLPSWENSVSNSRPSRFSGTFVWQLPFGHGQHFLNHGGWQNYLIGGFQTAGTFEAQEGQLVTWGNLFYTGCSDNYATCNTSSIKVNNPTYGKWFNTGGFSTTSPTGLNKRVFPRVIDGIRQSGINNWNLNLQKTVPITERANLELRLDAVDVFNHLIVAGPNTTPSSAQFGQVTSDAYSGQPNFGRFIQIQGRFVF